MSTTTFHPPLTAELTSSLTTNNVLMTPGPVQLHPEVQRLLSLPMIHHRTPEFDHFLKDSLLGLKKLFQTEQPVFILSSTGTGGMESLLVNTLDPNRKSSAGCDVIAIVSGKFGERWAEMAETFCLNNNLKVYRHHIAWGQTMSAEELEKILANHPQAQVVLTQACETSTATTHPIKQWAQVVAKTKALFLVDGITAVGAMPISMDADLIDGLVAGSQKAIMLPTGLSFVSFSKKAWSIIEKNNLPRFYFDIRKELGANKKGETYFSSHVSFIRPLHFILNSINQIGLNKLFDSIRRRADYTRQIFPSFGLPLYSSSPSDSVTALMLPPAIDGSEFRDYLEKKYHLTVMGGQDQLKGKILRLGHMGYLSDEDLHQCTLRIAQALLDFHQPISIHEISERSIQWLRQNPVD